MMSEEHLPEAEPGRGSAPVLRSAVRRLRQLSLAAEEGDFLGTEPDLQERLEVSRPTLRQAVRILEQDQMVEKRMGPRGGCYASRPNPAMVARAASLYLHGRKTTLQDLLAVSQALQQQALTLAVRSADAAGRENLRTFLAELDPQGAARDQSVFLECERRFEQLVLALADNPALDLIVQITRKFVDETPGSQLFIADAALRLRRAHAWHTLGEAILAGDEAGCLAIARAQSEAFQSLVALEAAGELLGVAAE
jgi:GntR family transcriptional regulator, transcriptional repressor for pyruvate dehydrogenase complex